MTSPVLAIVVPCHNEAANIDVLWQRMSSVLDTLDMSTKVLFVDDGSRDDTVARLRAIASSDTRLEIIALSRNFGKEAALTAGLDHAGNAAVILMDADLQHPPELIPKFIEAWRSGADMVYALRADRSDEGLAKRLFTRTFYGMLRRLGEVEIPADAGDFRLLDSRVVAALRALPERNRFMKGLYAWVGFRATAITYQVPKRERGSSSFSFARLLEFAILGLTAFSTTPLRLAAITGAATALLAMALALYELFHALALGTAPPGYTSTFLAVVFLGGLNLFFLGVIGEYLGRIYAEVKQRPVYIVRERVNSDP